MLVPGCLRKRCGREKHSIYEGSPYSSCQGVSLFGPSSYSQIWSPAVAGKHPCVRRNCPGEHQSKSDKSRTDYNRTEQNISQPNRVDQSRVKYYRSQYVYIYIYTYIDISKCFIYEEPPHLGGTRGAWGGTRGPLGGAMISKGGSL